MRSPRKPRVPLVAIYPKEGTLFSDNPLFVLDAPWVTAKEQQAAQRFEDFITQRRQPAAGAEVRVPAGQPAGRDRQADRRQERRRPEPAADDARGARPAGARRAHRRVGPDPQEGAGAARDRRVGFDGRPRPTRAPATTKLDLAKRAAIAALDEFQPEDDVGLADLLDRHLPRRADRLPRPRADRADVGEPDGARVEHPATSSRRRARRCTRSPRTRTTRWLDEFDPTRINAVVLLSDGRNEDDRNTDLDGLLRRSCAVENEGETTRPVRIFPIAYGADADVGTLKRIAEATNAARLQRCRPGDDRERLQRGRQQLLMGALWDSIDAAGAPEEPEDGRGHHRAVGDPARRRGSGGRRSSAALPFLIVLGVRRARVGGAGRHAAAAPQGRGPPSTRRASPTRGGASCARRSTRSARYRRAVSSATRGPLRERLVEIGERIDAGVDECWRIAPARRRARRRDRQPRRRDRRAQELAAAKAARASPTTPAGAPSRRSRPRSTRPTASSRGAQDAQDRAPASSTPASTRPSPGPSSSRSGPTTSASSAASAATSTSSSSEMESLRVGARRGRAAPARLRAPLGDRRRTGTA